MRSDAKRERNQRIRDAYAAGERMIDLAAQYGLSRQRIDQIVKPKKARARNVTADAIATGKLERPDACGRCGSTDGTVHAHHPDYEKPLEVEWICAPCHGREHAGEHRVEREVRTCLSCGAEHERLPSERAQHCSLKCAKRTTHRKLSAYHARERARRFQDMAARLRRYAIQHGYVPILSEFAIAVTGHEERNQAIPRLLRALDPNNVECDSYAAIADRLYQLAGFERPDGRSRHVRAAREARGHRGAAA